MKKVIHIPDDKELIAKLARLGSLPEGQALLAILEDADKRINDLWKQAVDDIELHRLQGAGQVVSDLIKDIKDAKEWLENIKR
jgi:hypothetical protein